MLALLTWLALGTILPATAGAAVLDRFEIETAEDRQNVKVVLYTEGRADYHTVAAEQGFTIILNDTKLDEALLKNGLPVVIDNQNRFIGRAVPGENNQVKVIIPNLPVDRYTVSVLQKPADEPAIAKNPATVDGRLNGVFESQFESVANEFKRPSRGWVAKNPEVWTPQTPRNNANIRPAVTADAYPQPTPRLTRRQPTPVQQVVPPQTFFPEWHPQESTLSTSPPAFNSNAYTDMLPEGFEMPGADADFSESVQGPADQIIPHTRPSTHLPYRQLDPGEISDIIAPEPVPDETADPATEPVASVTSPGLVQSIQESFSDIPLWAVILATLFFGGIGLFTLTGALLLMRILMSPALNRLVQPETPAMQSQLGRAVFADSDLFSSFGEAEADLERTPGKRGSSPDGPDDTEPPGFEDVARLKGSDYLIHSPDTVQEAVRNAVLLKFPSHRRGGSTSNIKPHASRPSA